MSGTGYNELARKVRMAVPSMFDMKSHPRLQAAIKRFWGAVSQGEAEVDFDVYKLMHRWARGRAPLAPPRLHRAVC